MNTKIKNSDPCVYIVDDDTSVRESLIWLLSANKIASQSYESAESLITAHEFQQAHQSSSEWRGCITMDVRMPGMGGIAALQALASKGNTLPIIMITGHADVPMAIKAMKLGAFDFIEKPYSEETLLKSVTTAIEADNTQHHKLKENRDILGRYQRLTPREKQVMALVITGEANKRIAASLQISDKTVEAHRAQVMQKMQVKSLSALVKDAVLLDET